MKMEFERNAEVGVDANKKGLKSGRFQALTNQLLT